MKRRITSILLFLLLLAPFLGTYTWLHYQKHTIRKSIKRKLISITQKEELVLLKFKKTEVDSKVRWEHSKEFEYQDEMYDIVESRSFGDSIHYYCWWDHEETALNRQLDELLVNALGGDDKRRSTKDTLIVFLNSLYCNAIQCWSTALSGEDINHLSANFLKDYHCEISPPSPPPRLI
ncbi:MAG: hypothetical protein ABJN36_07150 [Cyclobacteriaceae bacterium]